MEKSLTQSDVLSGLDNFTGTEQYYMHLGHMKLTEGFKWLCDAARCYWLADIVSSVQSLAVLYRHKDFQVWRVTVSPDKSCVVDCWADSPDESELLYHQEIPYTDFVLDRFEFYCIDDVILLKSEY